MWGKYSHKTLITTENGEFFVQTALFFVLFASQSHLIMTKINEIKHQINNK